MHVGFPIQQTNKMHFGTHKKIFSCVDYLKKKKSPLSGSKVMAFSEKMKINSCFQIPNCQNCFIKMQPTYLSLKSSENDNILISGRTVFCIAYISTLVVLIVRKLCGIFMCCNSDEDDDNNYSYSIFSSLYALSTDNILLSPTQCHP